MYDMKTKELTLIDFGFATRFKINDPIELTEKIGTPTYMSP